MNFGGFIERLSLNSSANASLARNSHQQQNNCPNLDLAMSANNALTSYLSTFNEFKSTPRIQSLYSDLGRQKISNPSGYAANLSWWRTTLQEIVSRRIQPKDVDALILHVDQDLSDSLRWEKVGRPAGLGTLVVSRFLSSSAILP
jgi:charged multivesicular body protein 7